MAMTSHGMRMVRYVDDFVIMCADQAEAERALELAQRQLTALRLQLHHEKTQIVG
jgi:RNA-directed DNA polymerase